VHPCLQASVQSQQRPPSAAKEPCLLDEQLIRNPFDNVGIPAKVLSLDERSSYETFQHKTLNVKTLRGNETDHAGNPSSLASRHFELETV
jgi:hypothetical protein